MYADKEDVQCAHCSLLMCPRLWAHVVRCNKQSTQYYTRKLLVARCAIKTPVLDYAPAARQWASQPPKSTNDGILHATCVRRVRIYLFILLLTWFLLLLFVLRVLCAIAPLSLSATKNIVNDQQHTHIHTQRLCLMQICQFIFQSKTMTTSTTTDYDLRIISWFLFSKVNCTQLFEPMPTHVQHGIASLVPPIVI